MGTRAQHSPAYRRLCRVLREEREAAGLSMRQLAESLGRVHSYVAKVEHGTRRIDPIEFAEWCEACGVEATVTLRRVIRRGD